MKSVIDFVMERFLKSQQTHQKFEKVKSELYKDLKRIVASIAALKQKIAMHTRQQEGAD